MKNTLRTRARMQNASEKGGSYKLQLWSSSCVVHPVDYGAYCTLFPFLDGGKVSLFHCSGKLDKSN